MNPNYIFQMKRKFHLLLQSIGLVIACCSTIHKSDAATISYRMHSEELNFDYISMVEFSDVAVIQENGAYRFHAITASLQDDIGLLTLSFSDYQNTYVDIFGSNNPTFVSFSFNIPSALDSGFSSARVGVGNSNGFTGLGTPDPTDIRVFQPGWISSNVTSGGITTLGAYLTTNEGINADPNYVMEVLVVIPEPTTALLVSLGALCFLCRRHRHSPVLPH
jgi:hypothetical protein